jgi:3-hydroxyisobutyrate dehydrogenase-like beta-hydroxyacid dehydrogenase
VRMERIGFIGMGLMGVPMSKRLLAAGYSLTVWNRTKSKAEDLIQAGAKWADSAKDVAASSDVVITMVTNSQSVEEVVCGAGGVLDGAHDGLILIDMSSIDATTSRSVAKRAASVGVGMLDAPVTGSVPQAVDGILGVMVGGERKLFDAVQPILGVLGSKVLYVGPSGAGSTMKLLNQLVFAVTLEVNAEALVLATKAGIDPMLLMDVLASGGARSGAMETRGPRILQRDFAPRFSLDNQHKDLTNALALAQDLKVSVPAGAAVHEIYQAARAQGKGGLDSAAVIQVLESLANTTVGKEQS